MPRDTILFFNANVCNSGNEDIIYLEFSFCASMCGVNEKKIQHEIVGDCMSAHRTVTGNENAPKSHNLCRRKLVESSCFYFGRFIPKVIEVKIMVHTIS